MRAHGDALLVVVIILSATAPAAGLDSQKAISQFTHTSWSAKDGIPGPIRAIAQTPDGYLWLGTEAGLYRFDGLRFVPIEPGAVAGVHQHSQAVWSLCAARDGSLWIGFGSGGVGRLQNGRLIHYSSEGGAPAGGAATDGRRFEMTGDPVRSNTILTLAPHARSFASTGEAVGIVWSMAQAPDGRAWLADTSGRKIRQIGTPLSSGLDAGGEPMSLGFDKESEWIGLIEGGVRRLINDQEPRRKALDTFYPIDGLSGGLIYSSFKDREVWTECGQEGRRCHAIVGSVTESAVPITVALLRSACSRP